MAIFSPSDPVTKINGSSGHLSRATASAVKPSNDGKPWSDKIKSGGLHSNSRRKACFVSTRLERNFTPPAATRGSAPSRPRRCLPHTRMQISFSNVGSNQIPIQAVRQLWPGRAALRRGWILPLLNLPDDRNGRRSRTVSCRFGPQRRFPWLPEAAQGPARPHEKSNNQDCGGEAEGNHPEWTMGTLMGKGEQKCQQRQRRRGDPLERRESPT